MSDQIVTLDVREDIRAGREPFTRIMQSAAGLASGDTLLLIVPFEPLPLYRRLAQDGFSHQSRQAPTGEWQVEFRRDPALAGLRQSNATDGPVQPPCGCAIRGQPQVEVDARGLEPPGPMVAILEAVAGLQDAGQVVARTDRRPIHLYPQLEARGFVGETAEQEDGSFVTRIRRRPA